MRSAELIVAVHLAAWIHSSAADSALRGPPSFNDQLEDLRKKLSVEGGSDHDKSTAEEKPNRDHDKPTADEVEKPTQKTLKDQIADVPEDRLAHLGKSLSKSDESASTVKKPKIKRTKAKSSATIVGAISPAVSPADAALTGALMETSCGRKLKACTGMCVQGPVGQLECLLGVKAPYVTSAITGAAFAEPTIVRDKTCASLGFSEAASDPTASDVGSNVSAFFSPGWTHTLVAKIAGHPPAVAAIKDGWLNTLKRASVMCE